MVPERFANLPIGHIDLVTYLVKENKGLVNWCMQNCRNPLPGDDVGDLEGCLKLTLTKSAKSFDHHMGIKFSTFCVRMLRFTAWHWENGRNQRIRVQNQMPSFYDSEAADYLHLDAMVADSRRPIDWADISEMIAYVKEVTTPFEWKVFEAVYLKGDSLTEAARKLKITSSSVSYIISKAIKEIREISGHLVDA